MSNLVNVLQFVLSLDGSMYSGRFVCLFNLCFPLALLVNGIHSTKNILVDYRSLKNTRKISRFRT